jgi:exodeoxyribonuclease VII small subunit
MGFEQHLQRLEAIAEQLDGDSLPLDDALKLFEEGIQLLRTASDELNRVESRVAQLVEEADGAVSMQDLDA